MSTPTGLGILTVVLLLFGFATIPVNQVASFLFSTPSSGYNKMSLLNLAIGVPIYFITKLLLADWAFIFRVLPHFTLAECVMNIIQFQVLHGICGKIGYCRKSIGKNHRITP